MEEQINRIKEVLVHERKTQKWLADQLDVTEQTVSAWCQNKYQPTIRQFVKIAKLLKVPLAELFYSIEKIKLKD